MERSRCVAALYGLMLEVQHLAASTHDSEQQAILGDLEDAVGDALERLGLPVDLDAPPVAVIRTCGAERRGWGRRRRHPR